MDISDENGDRTLLYSQGEFVDTLLILFSHADIATDDNQGFTTVVRVKEGCLDYFKNPVFPGRCAECFFCCQHAAMFPGLFVCHLRSRQGILKQRAEWGELRILFPQIVNAFELKERKHGLVGKQPASFTIFEADDVR